MRQIRLFYDTRMICPTSPRKIMQNLRDNAISGDILSASQGSEARLSGGRGRIGTGTILKKRREVLEI